MGNWEQALMAGQTAGGVTGTSGFFRATPQAEQLRQGHPDIAIQQNPGLVRSRAGAPL